MGKGLGTIAVWAAVGITAHYEAGAAIFVAFFAMIATLFIWGL